MSLLMLSHLDHRPLAWMVSLHFKAGWSRSQGWWIYIASYSAATVYFFLLVMVWNRTIDHWNVDVTNLLTSMYMKGWGKFTRQTRLLAQTSHLCTCQVKIYLYQDYVTETIQALKSNKISCPNIMFMYLEKTKNYLY